MIVLATCPTKHKEPSSSRSINTNKDGSFTAPQVYFSRWKRVVGHTKYGSENWVSHSWQSQGVVGILVAWILPLLFGEGSRNVFYENVVRKWAKHSINKLNKNSTLEALLVKWYYFRMRLKFRKASTTRSRGLDETSHTNWNEVWKTINRLTRTMSTPHETDQNHCVHLQHSAWFCCKLNLNPFYLLSPHV